MAEETTKRVLIEIDLRIDRLVKESQTAKQAIDELTAKQKEIEKQSGKNSAAYIENAAALRTAKKALQEANKGIDDRIKAQDSEAGSIRQMRAELSILTAERNSLSEAELLNTERGRELTEQTNALNEQLKASERAVGDNRRNVGNYTDSIIKALAEVERLKTVQEDLAKQGQQNTEVYKANEVALNDATEEYQEAVAASGKMIVVKHGEATAIAELEKNLGQLIREYNSLTIEQQKNEKVGGRLQAQIVATQTKLNDSKKAFGGASEQIQVYRGSVLQTISSIDLMPPAFSRVTNGVGGLSNAFKLLMANPIGIFIVALVGSMALLYKGFTQTDEGANTVKGKFEALRAVGDALLEGLNKLGPGLRSLFSGDILEGLKQLRKGISDIGDDMERAGGAADQYVQQMDRLNDTQNSFISESARVRNEIAKQEARSRDQTLGLDERKAALQEALRLGQLELERAKGFAKDRLDIELNRAAITKGVRIDELRDFIAASGEEAEAMLANNKKLAEAVSFLDSEEKIAELEGFYSAVTNLDTEFFESNSRNQARLSGFMKEEQDKRTQDAQEANAKRTQAAIDQLQAERDLLQIRIDDFKGSSAELLKLKTEALQKDRDIELLQTGDNKTKRFVIEEQYAARVRKLGLDTIAQEREAQKQALQDRIDDIEQFAERKNNLDTLKFLDDQKALQDQLEQGVITETQYQQQLLDMEFTFSQLKLQNKIDEINSKLAETKRGSDEELALLVQQKELEAQIRDNTTVKATNDEKKLKDAKLGTAKEIFSGTSQVFGSLSKLYEEGSDNYKAFASLEAAASAAAAAIAAYKSTAEIPVVGPALAPIAAAAAAAYGAIQVAKINALEQGGIVEPVSWPKAQRGIIMEPSYERSWEKAAKGIILGGRPHSQGGTKFVGSDGTRFEAEKGELLTVVNKKSTGMLKALSDINEAGGGVSFFKNGGVVNNEFADGGLVSRNVSTSVIERQILNNTLRETVSEVRPIVLVQDINDAQGTLVDVESRAVI